MIKYFDKWSEVVDYESDEFEVVLFNKNREVIGVFKYYGFTKGDFDQFKNK
jgi:hypothetical protein